MKIEAAPPSVGRLAWIGNKTNFSHATKFLCLGLLAGLAVTDLEAANIPKADDSDALNLGTSWSGGVVPGTSDIAVWDTTVSAANTFDTLGANMSWAGLKVVNPGAAVTITTNAGGNILTLGASGIDMSSATADLTMSNNVTVLDYTAQAWNVPSGRALSLNGAFTRSGGAVLTFNDNGTIHIAGGTASAPLYYSLFNGTDVGALDASQNVSSTALVTGYTANAVGGAPPTQWIDMVNGNTGTADDAYMGTKIYYPYVIRFNQPQPNRNYWSWNAYKGQTDLNTGANTILVTTNVGACDVIFSSATGNGAWIAMGWRASSGCELIVDQENTAGSIIFNGTFSQKNNLAGNILTKRGAGRAVFNVALQHSGPTRILEGELMLNGSGATYSTAVFIVNSGATLSGTAVIPSSVTNNGTIWPGTNGLGSITASNLTLNAGSGLKFYSVSVPTTNTAALLNITNAMTVNGTVNVSILSGGMAVGQYPLIKLPSALAGGVFANFSLAVIPPHMTAYLSNNTANASIDLVVSSINLPLKWAAGSANWDIGTSSNWKDTLGAATTYQELSGLGDTVLFEDTVSGASPITVTLNTTVSPGSTTVNASKSYTLSGSGTIAGKGALTKAGSSTLVLSTANSFSGGVNINGGILNFSALTNLGSGPINFGGGTLQYSGNTDDISARKVTFNAGGATIDTADNNVIFNLPVGNGGAGGLTKTGTGTLTLNGTNIYYGNTVVSQGTLVVGSGIIGSTFITNSPAIQINAGAVLNASFSGGLTLNSRISQNLSGSGTLTSSLTALSGTSITPGTAGTIGTLSFVGGDLALITNSTLIFDVSTTGSDLINLTNDNYGGGNLNIQGQNNLQINPLDTLTNGVYPLIHFSGSLQSGSGSSSLLNITTTIPGKALQLSEATPNEIDLVVKTAGGASKTWVGNQNYYWDIETSANWLNGSTPATYVDGDKVTFDDSSSQTYVALTTTVNPGAVTVNTANNYTLADNTGVGAGKIGNGASLTKSGSGTLLLQTPNTYTGPTVINAGTLQVDAVGQLGTGNVTNNGTLIFSQSVNGIVAGQVSGTGTLTQQGTATLTLAQNNSYTTTTVISSGSLQLGTNGPTGSLSGAVTDNGLLIINRSDAYAAPVNISGSGALAFSGSGATTLSITNAYLGNTYISNGIVKLGSPDAIPDAGTVSGSTGWLVLDGGLTAGVLDLNGFNETINALSGLGGTVLGVITNSGASGTNVITVTGAATPTYAGIIADNPNGAKTAIVQQGTGQLRFDGANTYTGGTIVKSGTLAIGPGGSAGASSIVLSNGTTFSMVSRGSASSFPGNNLIVAPASTITFYSGQQGNGFGGLITGDSASTVLFTNVGSLGANAVKQLEPFLGTFVIQTNSYLRIASTSPHTNGGDFTTFQVIGTINTRNGSGTPGLFLGALTGPSSGWVDCGAGTLTIGGKGIDSTFSGTVAGFTDYTIGTGTNHVTSLVKVGTGTLTLNGTITYEGQTTVSNGVLAIVAPAALTNSVGCQIGSGATLDLSAQADPTLVLGDHYNNTNGYVTNQWMSGSGTLKGNLNATTGRVYPGDGIGTLHVTGSASIGGTLLMELNVTNANQNDQLAATSVAFNNATLTVTNLGPTITNGTRFQLFNVPVTGTFASKTLPAGTYVWTDNLATDGSITLASGGILPVNTARTNITAVVSGNTLTLSWPTDHIGWRLLVQTNNLASGISSNTNDWSAVSGSGSVSQTTITIDPAKPAEFYRLVYP